MSRLKPKKISFLDYLGSAGFTILSRPVRKTPNGRKVQKGIDTYIYSDISELTQGDYCDTTVLVSGDEDFCTIIPRLREISKKIEVWSFKRSLSNVLRREAGDENVNYIDDVLDEIELKETQH